MIIDDFLIGKLIPKVLDARFNQNDLDLMLIKNPGEAFAIRVD